MFTVDVKQQHNNNNSFYGCVNGIDSDPTVYHNMQQIVRLGICGCTDYCSELYNHESYGDNAVLDRNQLPEEVLQLILREEVEIAIAAL